jgi:hypothetical protein
MMRASVHAYCAHHVSGVVNRHAHCRRYRCTDSRLCRGTRSERAVVVVTRVALIFFGGGGGGAPGCKQTPVIADLTGLICYGYPARHRRAAYMLPRSHERTRRRTVTCLFPSVRGIARIHNSHGERELVARLDDFPVAGRTGHRTRYAMPKTLRA